MARRKTGICPTDVWRVMVLVGLGLMLMTIDPEVYAVLDVGLGAVMYSVGVVLVLSGVTHVTRRVLMPDLDFQRIAIVACATPLGAGLTFLGCCLLICTLLFLGVQLMR